MKKYKKLLINSLVGSILLTSINPFLIDTQAQAKRVNGRTKISNSGISKNFESTNYDILPTTPLTNFDLLNIKLEFNNRLQLDEDLLDKSVLFEERGIRAKAAKEAAKRMKDKLVKIGKSAFERNIPRWLKGYISYESVMKALNIMTGFEDDVTTAATKGFISIGLSPYWAGVVARTCVTILL